MVNYNLAKSVLFLEDKKSLKEYLFKERGGDREMKYDLFWVISMALVPLLKDGGVHFDQTHIDYLKKEFKEKKLLTIPDDHKEIFDELLTSLIGSEFW